MEVTRQLNQTFNSNRSGNSIRGRLKYLADKGELAPLTRTRQPNKANKTYKANGDVVSDALFNIRLDPNKSPEAVLKAHGFDAKRWDIKQVVSNEWQQHSTADGTTPLFQSKIIVTPKVKLSIEEIKAVFANEFKPIVIPQLKSGERNLIIPLADLHFGIMSYDDFKPILEQIGVVLQGGYKTVVIEQLGDLFHSDQINTTQTVKGTQLDQVNMARALEDCKHFFDDLMTLILSHADSVRFYAMGGNHSFDIEYTFMLYLEERFKQAEFHKTTNYKMAYLLDKVGILIAHGDVALKKLPMLFATEYQSIWGQSQYREQHTGHYHTELVKDENGVVTRQFGTPKKSDAYERKNGFTMTNRKLQLLEFSESNLERIYQING